MKTIKAKVLYRKFRGSAAWKEDGDRKVITGFEVAGWLLEDGRFLSAPPASHIPRGVALARDGRYYLMDANKHYLYVIVPPREDEATVIEPLEMW